MFADEDLVIAELVEFDDARAILGEKRRKRLVGIVQGHQEQAELHHAISALWVWPWARSEEHTSELQSLMRISYAVFCLKKKKTLTTYIHSNSAYHTDHLVNNTSQH